MLELLLIGYFESLVPLLDDPQAITKIAIPIIAMTRSFTD